MILIDPVIKIFLIEKWSNAFPTKGNKNPETTNSKGIVEVTKVLEILNSFSKIN